MIEIIALIFLTREIGRLAETKGLNKTRWKVITVVGWITSEIIGAILGLMIFGSDNLFSAVVVGLAFAITSYFIVKGSLNKRPDTLDDDIERIGDENQ